MFFRLDQNGKESCDPKNPGHMSVNTCHSFWRLLCGYVQSRKTAGATKANVVVRIPRRIIQIRCESPGIGSIIPIPATEKGVLRFDLTFPRSIIPFYLVSSNYSAFFRFHLVFRHWLNTVLY